VTGDGLSGHDIVVTASTSNLGPGFDTLGLALARRLHLRVTDVLPGTGGRLECRHAGGAPPGGDLVAAGYRAGADALSCALPSLAVDVESDIPARAGLGSSAAARIAGLRLAFAAAGRACPPGRLITLGTALEGHPDNVSAAVLGGFTVSAVTAGGPVVSRAYRWPDRFALLCATAGRELDTTVARAAVARELPLANAVFNVQHTALLVAAVRDADAEAMRAALDDRLHQPARMRLVPGLADALALRHPSLIGIFLSGAGPSLIAVCDRETAAVAALLRRLFDRLGLPGTVDAIAPVQPYEPRADTPAASA
jgi:homoserine kinase